jgi:predicted transcriptional regulator
VDPNEVWLTVAQVCDRLNCSRSIVDAAIKRTEEPRLVARNIGQGKQPRYRVALSEVKRWMESLGEAS